MHYMVHVMTQNTKKQKNIIQVCLLLEVAWDTSCHCL